MWTDAREVHTARFLGKLTKLQKPPLNVSKNMCCPFSRPAHFMSVLSTLYNQDTHTGWGPLSRLEHNVP